MGQKRQTASKQKILEAYINLIKDKVTNNITVTDICKKAGVNRGTFYLNYLDKYDLDDAVTDYYYHFFSNILQGDLIEHPENITKALHFIYEERDFYSQVIALTSINMEKKISTTLESLLTNDRLKAHFMPFFNLPDPYGLKILTLTITNIITLWIKRNFQESPEEVTKIILTLAKA